MAIRARAVQGFKPSRKPRGHVRRASRDRCNMNKPIHKRCRDCGTNPRFVASLPQSPAADDAVWRARCDRLGYLVQEWADRHNADEKLVREMFKLGLAKQATYGRDFEWMRRQYRWTFTTKETKAA